MKISISGFLHFLKICSFPIIKIQTLLKNSNQKFVNFTIKVRFFDYILAKFLTFHRAKERKKERKIYYAHDISIYKLSVEIIELKNYYIMMLYKLRLDVRSSPSSVSFRVGYCMLIILHGI